MAYPGYYWADCMRSFHIQSVLMALLHSLFARWRFSIFFFFFSFTLVHSKKSYEYSSLFMIVTYRFLKFWKTEVKKHTTQSSIILFFSYTNTSRMEEERAYAASKNTVLHMKRLSQTESPIFLILFSLFPKAILFYFYYNGNKFKNL